MTNLTLSPEIRAMAEELMATRRFKKLTPYVEQLIREDHEKRRGTMMIASHRPPTTETNGVNSTPTPGSFQNLTRAFGPKNQAPKKTVKPLAPH